MRVCKEARFYTLEWEGGGATDREWVWLRGCCASNEESALLDWLLKLPGGLIAVEKAVGGPMAEVDSRVVSMTGEESKFPS